MIKRYTSDPSESFSYEIGEYVEYSDHAAIIKELLDICERMNESQIGCKCLYCQRITELRKEYGE